MAAATPSLIQSSPKQAVLSPTSAHFHVQTIKPHMSSHTRPEAHEMPHTAVRTAKNITFSAPM